MAQLILMRHGKSDWNKKNLFTGWIDIPLCDEGIEESLRGGELIKDISIDVIFTSTLVRGVTTALLAMSRHKSGKTPVIIHPEESLEGKWGHCYSPETEKNLIPVYQAWQLNERMYGHLQGLNKQATRELYGDEQVQIWRRSFDISPPSGESLKMTSERTLPYFREKIFPYLKEGKTVFVAAHGNSLRSIIMDLDKLSPEEVVNLEIETGIPIFYTFENGVLKKSRTQ